MKLGKTVLVEIVAIVQEGFSKGIDISQKLRDIDVNVLHGDVEDDGDTIELTTEYIKNREQDDPDKF